MELGELEELTLTYTSLDSIDYGAGAQLYGVMNVRPSVPS